MGPVMVNSIRWIVSLPVLRLQDRSPGAFAPLDR